MLVPGDQDGGLEEQVLHTENLTDNPKLVVTIIFSTGLFSKSYPITALDLMLDMKKHDLDNCFYCFSLFQIKSKTMAKMFFVTVVYCLLLPLSQSKVEESQYCSTQESSASIYSPVSSINDNRHVERFFHADLNLEKTLFETVAAYVERIVLPISVVIPGTDANIIISNLNIIKECNYFDNNAKCICFDEDMQNNTKYSLQSSEMPCDTNCSHLYMDEIEFCPENVKILTMEVKATGSFKLNVTPADEDPNEAIYSTEELKTNLTTILASSYSNLIGFRCVKTLQIRNKNTVDYELTINGQIKSKNLRSHVQDAVYLINQSFKVDLKSFQVKSRGLVTIEVSPKIVLYKKPLTINCTIDDNVESVNWFISGPEDEKEANISAHHYSFENNSASNSILKINATSMWKGKYYCCFYFESGSLIHEASGDSNIYLLPEEITTIPSQYSVSGNESIPVKCCIKDDGENYTVTLETKGSSDGASSELESTVNGTKCWKYVINFKFANTTVYNCTFTNLVRQSTSGMITISVLKENEASCKSEEIGGYKWQTTAVGQYAESNDTCEEGKVGKIVRFCTKEGQWNKVFVNCTHKTLIKLLFLAQELSNGRDSTYHELPFILKNLTDFIDKQEKTLPDNIATIKILDTLTLATERSNSIFNESVMSDFLSIASNATLNDINNEEQNNFHSSILMRSVEKFSEAFQSPEENYTLNLPNIMLKGQMFNTVPSKGYREIFSENYTTTVEIESNSLKDRVNNNSFTISSIIYSNLDQSLSAKNNLPNDVKDYFINSLVQSTTLKINSGTENMNSKITINMSFSPRSETGNLKTAKCVFWNYDLFEGEGGWSDEGCKSVFTEKGTNCTCTHLTSFTVLMAKKKIIIPFIEEITYTGLSISIGSLICFITIEIVVWNTVIKNNVTRFRHTTLINTAIALLFAQLFFLLGSIQPVKDNETLCTIATIFTHYFFLSVFFWTLAQSLTLLYRLIFVFHQMSKTTFMSFSFILGYVCPLAVVIAATTHFISKGKYKREDICWLNVSPLGKVTAFDTFIVPVGCIIGINMFILTVVIVKLMRPSVSEGKNKEDKETIKKIIKAVLILTPTFGLTWAIGFLLTEDNSYFLHYAFAILNSVQGLFILLTSSITETKVRVAFIKHFKSMTLQSTSETVYSKTTSHSIKK
ncbi:adhesion G protein-coupled receptor F5 [Rhincodon typus]|uniref:adhesion G protein-coupled receptor F5 n=1 Tax=Rhincodon typus TaxID=259920 RepID=UPI0020308557|nr:adhesion G protein-coupled receptor F5 [Rhincodon typus]